jgi:hypothetical protein
MICSFIANLTSLILYSPKELSEKNIRIRIIIHFVTLEATLLITANVMGWVTGITNTILLAVQIALIYALVRFLSWVEDKKVANGINEKLMVIKDNVDDIQEE